MREYRERLRAPLSWWLLGLFTILLLATEVAAGYSWPLVVIIYVVAVGALAALLLSWGWPRVEVTGGELRAGGARLPLSEVGEVSALDEAQARVLRGPRADPAAYLLIRPYLRRAVYVEVTSPAAGAAALAAPGDGGADSRPRWRLRSRRRRRTPGAGAPYWLVSTRHPAELAAAIAGARPAARHDGAAMG